MNQYYTASICFDGNTYAGSVSAAQPTLEAAIARAFSDATYYLGHHREVSARIESFCDACGGNGFTVEQRARSTKRHICKACKGHIGELSSISFPCVPAANVRTIDNGTGELVTHGERPDRPCDHDCARRVSPLAACDCSRAN